MGRQQIYTTKELAKYIKLNEKTIIKMAQNGELPGRKIGNQWRFHESAIETYLQKQIISSTDEQIDNMLRNQLPIVQLSRLVSDESIDLDCSAENSEQVLEYIAQLAERSGLTLSAQELLTELRRREKLLSTGLGNGIAIPHPRHPSKRLAQKPGLVIVHCPKGIDFNASDKKKVTLFMMICAPDEACHLKILANIAKLINKLEINNKAALTSDKGEFMRLLMDFDQKNIFSGM